MPAMVLAAGRGERMRPLTDLLPKPLLPLAGRSLLERQLDRIAAAGIGRVCINLAYKGELIADRLTSHPPTGLQTRFSWEPEGALETAGGIVQARPWAWEGHPPAEMFLLANADVYSPTPLEPLLAQAAAMPSHCLGLLVMVANPGHNPQGDFALLDNGDLAEIPTGPAAAAEIPGLALTYSGLAVLRPGMFEGLAAGHKAALGPLLRAAARAGRLRGLQDEGPWVDVGTPERLMALERSLLASAAKE